MQLKIYLLSGLLAAVLFSAQAQTPICKRDSSILKRPNNELFAPAPYTPESPIYRLNEACIGQPYVQAFTIKIPPTFALGTTEIPLVSASAATTGALTNLPKGLTYRCDPPNCTFLANTLGCILVTGTPTADNAPGTFDLGIKAQVQTALAPIDIEFPGQLAPNSHYYLILKGAGSTCVSSVRNLNGDVASMRNFPNPFTGQTTILIDALDKGTYTFEVFDVLGRMVHQRPVQLAFGENQLNFNAEGLAKGSYRYSLRNAKGVMTRTLTVE